MCVCADPLRMPESVKASVAKSGVLQVEHNELSREVLQESDVLYVTRVQKERFNSEQEYLELASAFVVRNSNSIHRLVYLSWR